MDTLVKIILNIIVFMVLFVLASWFFLGLTPSQTWNRTVRKIDSLFSSSSTAVKQTGGEAGDLIGAAATVDQTLINKANEKYSGK